MSHALNSFPHPAAFASLALLGVAVPIGSSSSPLAGQLQIHNDRWDAVSVEIRIGDADQCSALPAFTTRTLRRGGTWTIQVTDPVICWRRETPGSGGTEWTTWDRRTPAPGTIENVDL